MKRLILMNLYAPDDFADKIFKIPHIFVYPILIALIFSNVVIIAAAIYFNLHYNGGIKEKLTIISFVIIVTLGFGLFILFFGLMLDLCPLASLTLVGITLILCIVLSLVGCWLYPHHE